MKVKIFTLSVFLVTFLFILIFSSGCTNKYEPASNIFSSTEESSCTHCHLNSTILKEVATPLPPDTSEATGEG